MTNHHERIYALLVEANPVEDPDQAREIIDRRRDRLSLVTPRRHDMTDLREATPPEAASKRRRWTIPFAAAAVALVLIGVVALIPESDTDQPDVATTPVPTTIVQPTTTTPPTTAAPTTAAPTINSACVFWWWSNETQKKVTNSSAVRNR